MIKNLLFVILFFPLFCSLLILLFAEKHKNLRDITSLICGSVLFLCCVRIMFFANDFTNLSDNIIFQVKLFAGQNIAFHLEPLSLVFATMASFLFTICTLYSIGYMRSNEEKYQSIFYSLFSLAIFATMGVAFSANLLTMFLFYELLTLSTFGLVAHKRNDVAKKGAQTYAAILLFGSLGLFLPAIIWVITLVGNGDFTNGGILNDANISAFPLFVLLALFVFGIGKAALMPMHRWLPAAMVAPTPVSAFLHAVAVVKVGVFAILKIVIYIFGMEIFVRTNVNDPFIWLCAFTILMSSIIAMNKDNLKARLAYSTISQLAYVTLGAMLANRMGLIGGMSQLVIHAFAKMTLFMCAGAIYVATHKTLVSEFDGLGRKMPITFALFFIAALSIIGLPPLAGTWPKFYLLMGAYDKGSLALMLVLLVSSLFNIWYLLSIPIRAFMLETKRKESFGKNINFRKMQEAPLLCLLPPMITAFSCFILFFAINLVVNYLSVIIDLGK